MQAREASMPGKMPASSETSSSGEQLVALYAAAKDARRARDMIVKKGVAKSRVALLAPDSVRGIQLATRRATKASVGGWLGMLAGSSVGGLVGAAFGQASLSILGLEFGASAVVAGLILAFVFGTVGALLGAILGTRRAAYKTEFSPTSVATKGGSVLGVVTRSKPESETVGYVFRSTGAIDIHAESTKRSLRVV